MMVRISVLCVFLVASSKPVSADPVAYPSGGILTQFTTAGLDYVISMAEKATAKLMRDFPIPDMEGSGYSVSKVSVESFDPPVYDAHFRNQSGLYVNVTIPHLTVLASYKAGYGFLSTSGNVKCQIGNLTVAMTIRVPRGKSGYPSIDLPLCNATIDKFDLVFSEAGATGAVMNMLRGALQGLITTSISSVVCWAARNTTRIVETVFFDLEKPIPELVAPANKTGPPPTADEMLNLTVICGPGIVQKPPKTGGPTLVENVMSNFIKAMDGLSVDLKMDQDAYFTNDDMITGLRADFLYKGKPSGLHPAPLRMAPTKRGLCFAVSEATVNAFCLHGQAHNYFALSEEISYEDLAPEMQAKARLLCHNCKLTLDVKSLEQPVVHLRRSGVEARAKLNVEVVGQARLLTKRLVDAQLDLDVGVHVVAEGSAIKGSIALKSTHVKLNKVGLTGVLERPVNEMLRRFVPRFIWPVVERVFNKLMQEHGVKLPAYCGISFSKSQVTYTDGDVVVCSDIVYDIDGFLDRVTKNQHEKLAEKAALANLTTTTSGGWWS